MFLVSYYTELLFGLITLYHASVVVGLFHEHKAQVPKLSLMWYFPQHLFWSINGRMNLGKMHTVLAILLTEQQDET
jgi:hypothetical protein